MTPSREFVLIALFGLALCIWGTLLMHSAFDDMRGELLQTLTR